MKAVPKTSLSRNPLGRKTRRFAVEVFGGLRRPLGSDQHAGDFGFRKQLENGGVGMPGSYR